MNYLKIHLFLTLFLMNHFCNLQAQEYLIYPVAESNNRSADLGTFLNKEKIVYQWIFSDSEKTYLQQAGFEDLAQAAKINLTEGESLHLIVQKAAIQKIKIRLDHYFPIEFSSTPTLDPLVKYQWGLWNRGTNQELEISDIEVHPVAGIAGQDIGWRGASPEGEQDVIVATLDTGIDTTHPDLTTQIYRKPGECAARASLQQCLKKERDKNKCYQTWANVDTDGNGYPLDCEGWNVLGSVDRYSGIQGSNDVTDDVGHGTHVAGIIAAAWNRLGVQGVSTRAKILPIKVIKEPNSDPARPLAAGSNSADPSLPSPIEKTLPKPQTFADFFARGLLYAIRSGAQIINISLGWPRDSDSLFMRRLVQLAQQKNILIVSAAGNDSSSAPVYPCLYDHVICVAATGADGALAKFSNFGNGVDIAAPGHAILSTWPMSFIPKIFAIRNGFEFKNGTSMASPFVAGLAARLKSHNLSSSEIFARLMLGARPLLRSNIDPLVSEKFIRSGQADLKQSLALNAVPMIMPIKKEPLFISWDRKSPQAKFNLDLKNYWLSAQHVKIVLKLNEQNAEIKLSQNTFELENFISESERRLTANLELAHTDINSEYELFVEIYADNYAVQKVKLILEFIVPLTPQSELGHVEKITIEPALQTLIKSAELRTIEVPAETINSSELPQLKYLAITKERAQWKLNLLQVQKLADSSQLKLMASTTITAMVGNLLGLYEIDLNGDQSNEYILAFNLTQKEGGSSNYNLKFLLLDKQLQPWIDTALVKPAAEWVYSNNISPIPETFRWFKINKRFYPLWIYFGLLPDSELAPATPWHPVPQNSKDNRLYYFDGQNLKTINAPAGYRYVELISGSNDSDTFVGSRQVILAKAQKYWYEFFVGLVNGNQTQVQAALTFDHYHQIGGLAAQKIYRLNSVEASNDAATTHPVCGSAYGSESSNGRQRITFIGSDTKNIFQKDLTPIDPLSSLHRLAGAFSDGKGNYFAFAQSMYHLEFHDLNSNKSAHTNLKRFGFMARNYFDKFYYPLILSKHYSQEITQTPAMYVPAGLGASLSAEVIHPEAQQDGQLVLKRPAKFRVLPLNGCSSLNPQEPTASNTSATLVYYCPNSIIKVPLK